ncbi:MAG TPA: ABC transporter permease [Thermoplasmata archaeon]|jgi:peptide/nickel transport system permease protein|nr:ABC transporter permease [Thermoplasmata archaeon]
MAAVKSPRAPQNRLAGLLAELQPRWKELRYSLHLLRTSLLAMVGLALVITFLFLAVFGPALAPYPYLYNASERNSPPGERPVVLRNNSALQVVGPAWTSLGALDQVVARADDRLALSTQVGDTLELRRFSFQLYTDDVVQVGVVMQYNATVGSTGDVLNVSVSGDGGASWSPVVSSPFKDAKLCAPTGLRSSLAGGCAYASANWVLLDFTRATNWTASRLGVSTFVVRVSHALLPGSAPGGVAIDAVRVVIGFQGLYHGLGTTVDGEDVLTGVLLGARISVRIGVIVVFVATLIGSLLGALAGYFGGPLDELVMRITDVFLSIPGLILALAVAAALGRSLDNVMYALIIVYWPPYTRLVRAQALSVRENLYVEASRATGASEWRVVTRHVLPNAISPILVQSSLDAGSVVLVAAGLSFLGIGAQPGTPEWGLMVSRGFTFFPLVNWWQTTFSGLMIFMFVLGFNLLGDGVRDILDPRLRR